MAKCTANFLLITPLLLLFTIVDSVYREECVFGSRITSGCGPIKTNGKLVAQKLLMDVKTQGVINGDFIMTIGGLEIKCEMEFGGPLQFYICLGRPFGSPMHIEATTSMIRIWDYPNGPPFYRSTDITFEMSGGNAYVTLDFVFPPESEVDYRKLIIDMIEGGIFVDDIPLYYAAWPFELLGATTVLAVSYGLSTALIVMCCVKDCWMRGFHAFARKEKPHEDELTEVVTTPGSTQPGTPAYNKSGTEANTPADSPKEKKKKDKKKKGSPQEKDTKVKKDSEREIEPKQGSAKEKAKDGSAKEKPKNGSVNEKPKNGSVNEKPKDGSTKEKPKEGSAKEKPKDEHAYEKPKNEFKKEERDYEPTTKKHNQEITVQKRRNVSERPRSIFKGMDIEKMQNDGNSESD